MLVAFYGFIDRLIVFEALKHNYSFLIKSSSKKLIYMHIYILIGLYFGRLQNLQSSEHMHADQPQPFFLKQINI